MDTFTHTTFRSGAIAAPAKMAVLILATCGPSADGSGENSQPVTSNVADDDDGDGDGDDDDDGDGDGDDDDDDDDDPDGWKLVWSDEFDGPEIDATKWAFEVNGTGGGNNELQYYTDRSENARIEDGALIIEAHAETFTGPDGTREYTSARLRTFELAEWQYGRVDASARLPKGQGLWPAIWMLPTESVYGGWAASGEIDIMELVGHEPSRTYGTLHFGGEWPNNVSSGEDTAWGTHAYDLPDGDFSQAFHTFTLEWEGEEMRWYVDGEHFQTQVEWRSDDQDYPAPFDQLFHLLLNVAVGGTWPGNPDETTQFPQQMVVDYVRVYEAVD